MKRTSIWCLIGFVIVALSYVSLSVNLHAQGDITQQIKELQQQSRDAQMKNDASWAQQHLADGFVAGNSWGDWETKDDFIKDLQNKTNKWKSGNLSEVQVTAFGSSTAVSRYTFTYDAELRGTHRARTVICSDTWINDSGTWKTAANRYSGCGVLAFLRVVLDRAPRRSNSDWRIGLSLEIVAALVYLRSTAGNLP